MLFYSPHANFQVIIRPTRIKFHPTSGDEIERVPAIWANFGKLGPTYDFVNPETGETQQGAQIVGHYFDTDLEAVQLGWDEEEKALVERKLLGLCQRQPERIRYEERIAVRAASPWPTYDDCDADTVLQLAPALGLVAEALAYERENRERPAVVDGLEAELAGKSDPVPGEGEPEKPQPTPAAVAVVEPEPVVGSPSLRTITV